MSCTVRFDEKTLALATVANLGGSDLCEALLPVSLQFPMIAPGGKEKKADDVGGIEAEPNACRPKLPPKRSYLPGCLPGEGVVGGCCLGRSMFSLGAKFSTTRQ